MANEPIDAEYRDADEGTPAPSRSLSVVPVMAANVSLAVSPEEAFQQWRDYQELTQRLLDDSDYQSIGRSKFKKKSAWRKYAKAFNLTDEVTFEHIERDERFRPVFARIRVRVTAPNGRFTEADQEAHRFERCCPTIDGDQCPKRSWRNHTCCTVDCSGWIHWSHPGDIPATALTRAKNRAIADMIGAGEVSAEEMGDAPSQSGPVRPPQASGGRPLPQVEPAPKAHRFMNRDLQQVCKDYEVTVTDIARFLRVDDITDVEGILGAIDRYLEGEEEPTLVLLASEARAHRDAASSEVVSE